VPYPEQLQESRREPRNDCKEQQVRASCPKDVGNNGRNAESFQRSKHVVPARDTEKSLAHWAAKRFIETYLIDAEFAAT